ncbi:MAG TPA: peptidoglycan editing factor PgeF [Candidatus Binatia bacterium]|nr:peptidoglycan editing factor PgeF [Candidatus Binatia bacterium]
MEISWLKVPRWEKYETLLHGFMGRRGGKSVGPYAGLNVSYRVGDDAKIVSQNVCDMKQAVGIHDGSIITMKQVHGDQIIEVKHVNVKEAGEGDGMKTGEKEAFLGILTADCVPILLVVPDKKIVAAVHAGWRGTLAGIATKMVGLFGSENGISPDAVEAALGPAIGPCCYDVKEDVSRPLIERWGKIAEPCVENREGKTYLDLRRLNRAIMEQAGVPSKQIYDVGPCTSCSPDEFFSYRREKKETGRQISFIGWAS